ncbi:single-stranded DNA-binding protein [Mycetocola saprophilus]|uniref:single-stranded DNA-binding protein n=1 Tax=Mycetocola saprophilus TaxID=76636 RepID=UPI003BF03FBD
MSYVTLTGNLTEAPTVKTTQEGKKYLHVGVIVNDSVCVPQTRSYEQTGHQRYNLTVFGAAATNLAKIAAAKGNVRVLFAGRLTLRDYTNKQNQPATSLDVNVDHIGLDLLVDAA